MRSKPSHQLKSLSVDQIMVPSEKLERADTAEEASSLHAKFDIVPWPGEGLIGGYFHKSMADRHKLKPHDLISHGTPVSQLPSLFSSSDFFFVIEGNSISGYIHYSDLNHPFAKIPLFATVQEAERLVWEKVHSHISRQVLEDLFGQERADSFIAKRNRIQEQNVELDWTGVFTLPFILKIGRYLDVINLDDDEIEILRTVQNRVAHSDRGLIESREDIESLVRAQTLAASIARSA